MHVLWPIILEMIESVSIDLALVDIMMPKMDGYELIRSIRKIAGKYIPIMVISAKVGLSDRILGMEIGADDYITKPFEPLEVVAKVKAQVRRLDTSAVKIDEPNFCNHQLKVKDVTLNLFECVVAVNDKEISLTKAEFLVLELLMRQPKRVFTKEQIYQAAWYEQEMADDNTIRVIISRLRDKVGSEHIKTIRGLGYRFE